MQLGVHGLAQLGVNTRVAGHTARWSRSVVVTCLSTGRRCQVFAVKCVATPLTPSCTYPGSVSYTTRSGDAGKGGHITSAAHYQVPSRSWRNDIVLQGAQVPVLQLPALAKNKTVENKEVKENAPISLKSSEVWGAALPLASAFSGRRPFFSVAPSSNQLKITDSQQMRLWTIPWFLLSCLSHKGNGLLQQLERTEKGTSLCAHIASLWIHHLKWVGECGTEVMLSETQLSCHSARSQVSSDMDGDCHSST